MPKTMSRPPANNSCLILNPSSNAETSALAAATDPLTETLDRIMLKPSKSNIAVKPRGTGLGSHWRMTDGTSPLPGHRRCPRTGQLREPDGSPLSRMALRCRVFVVRLWAKSAYTNPSGICAWTARMATHAPPSDDMARVAALLRYRFSTLPGHRLR